MERQSDSTRPPGRRSATQALRLALLLVLAGVFLVVQQDHSTAQQPFAQFRVQKAIKGRVERAQPVDGVFLPVDREMALKLDRAKEMLAKGQVADAVLELDRILDQREDFFFKPDPNQTVHRSLKAEAQRLLGGLDKDQRRTYELQFGVKARQLLDEATRTGSLEPLTEAIRRYFHTDAGYEAALVLARHYVDHAQPLAAALMLERVKSAPYATEKYDPNLSLMLAACWLRAGLEQKAKVELARMKSSYPDARLELAGKTFRLQGESEALTSLAAIVSAGRSGSPAEVVNWTMPGGNAARNAAMSGGSPLLNERWSASVFYSKSLANEILRSRKQFIDSGRAVVPCAQPLAVGDLVLMRTPHVVYAVDFESGKLLWPWPPEGVAEEQVNAGRDPGYMQAISERTWENNTYGTMTSDGELLFLVHEGDLQQALRGSAQWRTPRAVIMANGQMVQQGMHNVLSAHSLRREGAIEWHVGGLESEMEPQLAGAYFLGPPLSLQGQLYVLAEIKGGISLVVLDAKTGKLEWTQQLAIVEQSVQLDPVRRMSGATPSFADGVLVCPTSAGAVVAVDLATRSLLWGFQYPRTPEQDRLVQQRANMGWNFNGNIVMPINPGVHWADSNAVIAEGRVYITAMESDQLHCLSLLDGKPLWPAKKRESGLYIGAVSGGRLVVVCEQDVKTFDASDGKLLRATPLGSSRPSGRGFYSGQDYFLPLSSAEVIKIDLATADIKARARSRTGAVPGNLICYNGFVISQGVESLDKYFQLEPLRKQVDEILAKSPGDPEALAWRGEISLDDGNLARAVADLRKSFEFRPPADAKREYINRLEAEHLRTRGLLIDALTASLQQDFAANKESLAQLESLIETDQERAAYLRVLAAGLQHEGKTAEALANYFKLADLKTTVDELEEVEPGRSVRRERWIGARLEELWKSATKNDRAAIDSAVASRLEAAESIARSASDQDARSNHLRQFVATFAFHPLADAAREKLLTQLGEAESSLEREQLLMRLEKSADRRQAGAAAARLASLYESADRQSEAAMYYRKLDSEFAGVVCLDGKTGKELVAALPADHKVRRAMDTSDPWPVGEVKSEKKSRPAARNQGYQQYWNIDLQGDQGPFFQGRSVQLDQSMFQLVGRDELGRESFRVLLNEAAQFRNYGFGFNTNSAVVDGHLLLLNTGFQVIAINTLRSDARSRRVLWHEDLADAMQLQMQQMMGFGGMSNPRTIRNVWGDVRTVPTANGSQPMGITSPVIDGGVAILRGRELSFLDALTGKPLWIRHNVPPLSDIFGDAEVLIVAPGDSASGAGGSSGSVRSASPGTNEALVLRTRDGELLGKCKAPRLAMRWATYGRHLLTWDPLGSAWKLQLVDCWGDKKIDLGQYSRGSKGTIVGGDSVAIYDTAGKFVVRSLVDGRKLLEAAVEPDTQLQNIYVQRSANQYLLISNRPRIAKGSARQEVYQPAVLDPNSLPTINGGLVCGRVYTFDRTTGESQWQVPALIDMHGYFAAQGAELPVLVFIRHATDPRNAQMKVSILCLDKRTGRAVYQDDNVPGQAYGFEVSADPEARTVALQLPGETRLLTFTDKPIPPEPPYQAPLEPSRENAASRTSIGRIFGILGEAAERLGEAKSDGSQEPQPKNPPDTKKEAPANPPAKE